MSTITREPHTDHRTDFHSTTTKSGLRISQKITEGNKSCKIFIFLVLKVICYLQIDNPMMLVLHQYHQTGRLKYK